MNFKTPITSLLTIIAGLSTMACVQELPGHVESLQSEFQLKNTDGELIDVPTGPMTMSVESKGIFFDSKVTIKVGSQKVKFKVPKTAFTGENSLEVDAATIEQPVDLEVSVETQFLGSTRRTSTERCSHLSFCYMNDCTPGYNFASGEVETTCHMEWALRTNCPGSKDIEIETNGYNDTYTARFSKDRKDVGIYTSQPVFHSSTHKIRDLSDCR